MEKDLISVIIPIYNVEKYLNKCLNNIVQQTHENLEIILVDDGSPDNCPDICDQWQQKDKRIKVIHKPNGGVSDARNKGLDIAQGKYVSFIDPDDIIDLEMLSKLYNSAEQNSADIAMCGFKYIFEDGGEKLFVETNLPLVNSQNIIHYFLTTGTENKKDAIYSQNIMGSVCRTLIKKECIKDLRFKKLLVAEDMLFLMDLIDSDKKISIVNEPLYGYFQRNSSVIHSFSRNKIEQRYKAFKIILDNINGKIDEHFLKGFKFFNFASLTNEMLKNGQKAMLKEFMKDKFFASLNSKEGYKLAQSQTKEFKRKLGFFLVHKKRFGLYKFLVKFRKEN